MAVAYSVVQQVGEGFVHCIVGVFWEVWSHAMLVIVVERITAGGAGQTNVDGYPKISVGHMRETNGASLTTKYLTRSVI